MLHNPDQADQAGCEQSESARLRRGGVRGLDGRTADAPRKYISSDVLPIFECKAPCPQNLNYVGAPPDVAETIVRCARSTLRAKLGDMQLLDCVHRWLCLVIAKLQTDAY